MQLFVICFFVIAVFCIFEGWRRSTGTRPAESKHYCSGCGWTTEQVQPCELEVQRSWTIAPLCFDCTIKHEAVPVKTFGESYSAAYA